MLLAVFEDGTDETGRTGVPHMRDYPSMLAPLLNGIWHLHPYLKRRSLTEFATTDTDENAIAAAAIIGFRKPSAARGIAAVL
jgi:hypothetical protein